MAISILIFFASEINFLKLTQKSACQTLSSIRHEINHQVDLQKGLKNKQIISETFSLMKQMKRNLNNCK